EQTRSKISDIASELQDIKASLNSQASGVKKKGKQRALVVQQSAPPCSPSAIEKQSLLMPQLATSPNPSCVSLNNTTAAVNITQSPSGYPETSFPLSHNPLTRTAQLACISDLEKKYGRDRLLKHSFEWIMTAKGTSHNEYLPQYIYWTPKGAGTYPSVREIWMEYTFGIDGQLSVSQLNAGWNARWRSAPAARTETSRRKKIVDLIDELVRQPNWTAELALRYLESQYRIPTPGITYLSKTRSFIEHLQKKDGQLKVEILTNAKKFFNKVSIVCVQNE
ncbi:hypothetical protein H0H93_008223, partial [Arthromyces matolae]